MLREGRSFLPGGELLAQWADAVGPLARGVRAVALLPERGELVVRAISSAWATQTRLLAPALVQRVNEKLGEHRVRSLHILPDHGPLPVATRPITVSTVPSADPLFDAAVRAAAERQSRTAAQEPAHATGVTAADSRDRSVRARALQRARTERSHGEEA